MQPLARTFFSLNEGAMDPERIVGLMVQGIEQVLQAAGQTAAQVIGAGIGFPGVVDPARGISVFPPNWGWHDVSITGMLSRRVSIPIHLDNGAKALALGELIFGGGRGASNMIVVLVGTGVGGGIITEGKLFRGSTNNAGEIGHTTLNLDGPPCRCGSQGCLEVYVGANAITSRYKEMAGPKAAELPAEQVPALKQILDEYERGSEPAARAVEEALSYLGAGLANVINAFNPERVLLGGWLGLLLSERFLPQITAGVQRYTLKQSLVKTVIQAAELGQGAVAMGGAALVLEHFFENAGETQPLIVGGRTAG
jgi:predicted NBD/HSP70 family sugar kinase